MQERRKRKSTAYHSTPRNTQRKRRNRKRRKRSLLRRVVLVGIAVACLVAVTRTLQKSVKRASWKQDDTQTEVSMVDTVHSHEHDYPESLQQLLKRNPETAQFVYDYPWEKDEKHEIDLSGEVTKGEVPLFLQWDERWGYETYGSDMIAITGCGPTCLSMVICGVTGSTEWSPLDVAQYAGENGYYAEGAGTTWTMMSRGAAAMGLQATELSLSDNEIRSQLEAGNPIICTMGPGDFTNSGHFIVLSREDEDGTIQVRDPNSKKNSEKGWNLQDLMDQMQNLWAYTAA